MFGLGGVFRTARVLGDISSLENNDLGYRAASRGVGKLTAMPMRGMSIHGLFMWAAFLGFLNNAVKLAASKDIYIANAMRYAYGYEQGFTTIASGRRLPPPGYGFWEAGLKESITNSWQPYKGGFTFSRSGLYIGGRFAADIRAIYKGSLLSRSANRIAGRETTRLFWGTLGRPDLNPNEVIAKRAIAAIRRNIRGALLIDTTALAMATQYAGNKHDAMMLSRRAGMEKLLSKPSRYSYYGHMPSAASLYERKIVK
jgi:hypothetical protein